MHALQFYVKNPPFTNPFLIIIGQLTSAGKGLNCRVFNVYVKIYLSTPVMIVPQLFFINGVFTFGRFCQEHQK